MWNAGIPLAVILSILSSHTETDLDLIPDLSGWRLSSKLSVFCDTKKHDFYSQLLGSDDVALHKIHSYAGPDIALWLKHEDGRKALFLIQTKNREQVNFVDAFESLQPCIFCID